MNYDRTEKAWRDEDLMRDLIEDNTTYEIAEIVGCTQPTVIRSLSRHGIEVPHRPNGTWRESA